MITSEGFPLASLKSQRILQFFACEAYFCWLWSLFVVPPHHNLQHEGKLYSNSFRMDQATIGMGASFYQLLCGSWELHVKREAWDSERREEFALKFYMKLCRIMLIRLLKVFWILIGLKYLSTEFYVFFFSLKNSAKFRLWVQMSHLKFKILIWEK